MKKLIILLLLEASRLRRQLNKAYKDGEWFRFRVHYGFVTAG